MTQAYISKYPHDAFDPNDPDEALADRARGAVVTAYLAVMQEKDDTASRPLEYLVAGLLVGLVQVIQSSMDASDENDARIRASIIQSTAWAVDTARLLKNLDPLSDGN